MSAPCSVCSGSYAMRRDGRLRQHLRRTRSGGRAMHTCPGSGEPPLDANARSVAAAELRKATEQVDRRGRYLSGIGLHVYLLRRAEELDGAHHPLFGDDGDAA